MIVIARNALNAIFTAARAGAVGRSVRSKLGDFPTVQDFGAKGDGITDDTAAFNAAAALGIAVRVPQVGSYYLLAGTVALASGTRFLGEGDGSRLHFTLAARTNGLNAAGTALAPLSGIRLERLRITGLANWFNVGGTALTGANSGNNNGTGINLTFCNDSRVESCSIDGWSDGGIAMADCQRSEILNCATNNVAQGVQFFAVNADCFDNKMIGNKATNTGLFNGIHCEGHASAGPGVLHGTIFSHNSSNGAWGLGVNIENAQDSVVIGNTATNSGLGAGAHGPDTLHGIFGFGAPNSVFSGNKAFGNAGYGLMLSANCGNCSVCGNTTSGNTLGAFKLSDGGTATSNLVAVGVNAFNEATRVTYSGNVSTQQFLPSVKFDNVAKADVLALDWFEKGNTFMPVVTGDGTAGAATYTVQKGRFIRIGNTVWFRLYVAWSAHTGTGNIVVSGLPYAEGNFMPVPVSVWRNGLPITAGNGLQGVVPQNQSTVALSQITATGVASAIPLPAACLGLQISGQYQVAA